MSEIWPIIAVADVPQSSRWYMKLLDALETHSGAKAFNQIVDDQNNVLICLHYWGPSGPSGDHEWPPLMTRAAGDANNGLLLWFVCDDFEAAWLRAQNLQLTVVEEPNTNNGTGMRAFMVRDPDGYYVVVNERNR